MLYVYYKHIYKCKHLLINHTFTYDKNENKFLSFYGYIYLFTMLYSFHIYIYIHFIYGLH